MHTAHMLANLSTLSRGELNGLGLDVPDGLADASISLWRSSAKTKYHWADKRCQCQHAGGTRWTGVRPDQPLVSHRVPALEFDIPTTEICSGCMCQVSLSEHADTFVCVAAELLRARAWMARGDAVVASREIWTWLQFARWRAAQPLQGTSWMAAAQSLKGGKWCKHALDLRNQIIATQDSAAAMIAAVISSIGDDAGRTALLERAVRMVETDTETVNESNLIMAISGCRRRKPVQYSALYSPNLTYDQPPPWQYVAGWWLSRKQQRLPAPASEVIAHIDELFPHVHDLQLLDCRTSDVVYEPGDCVHSWADRVARAHRHELVGDWVNRLEMALEGLTGTHDDASPECTHLVVVEDWPIVRDDAESLAYLSQFDVAAGPHGRIDQYHYDAEQVVVLRVPEWAAAHVAELPRPMACEPITDERHQASRMLRGTGVAVTEAEFENRRKPSTGVAAARRQLHDDCSPQLSVWQRRGTRPLVPGARPPNHYGDGQQWTRFSVQHVLQPGAIFVYGYDDIELLKLGLPDCKTPTYGMQARVTLELQAGCPRRGCEDGPHVCDIRGVLIASTKNGALTFIPEGMRDIVTVPPAYLVGLEITR